MKMILFICGLFLSVASLAGKPAYDSSVVQQRSFDSLSLRSYSHNKDFQYEQETIQQRSWWEKFWDWFWSQYDNIISTEGGRITMKVIYWLLGIGTLVFFIVKVSRMSKVNLFTPNAANSVPYTAGEENIHSIAFEEAIDTAVQNGNFRLAIRLLYLQSLKLLADKNIILWQSNKTNSDYLKEISSEDLRSLFRDITTIFEYAWYGEVAVSRDDFRGLRESVLHFQNQL